jgi:hypothetical protein
MSTHTNGTTSLEWVLDASGGWELQDGVSVWAQISPGERGWVATAGNDAFILQRVGFHRPRIVVRPMGELAEIAHLQHDWHGHRTLCVASGPCYDFERSTTGLIVRATDGTRVARLDWSGRPDSAAARVHLDSPEATGRFGLLILMVAGSVLIDDLFNPSMPRSIGALAGPTVRGRFA